MATSRRPCGTSPSGVPSMPSPPRSRPAEEQAARRRRSRSAEARRRSQWVTPAQTPADCSGFTGSVATGHGLRPMSWALLLFGLLGVIHAVQRLGTAASGRCARVRVELLRLLAHDRAGLAPRGDRRRRSPALAGERRRPRRAGRRRRPGPVPRRRGDLREHRPRHPPHGRHRARARWRSSSPDPTPRGSRGAMSCSRSSWVAARASSVVKNVEFARASGKVLRLDVTKPVEAGPGSTSGRRSCRSTAAAGSSATSASRASRCSTTSPPTAGSASTPTTGSPRGHVPRAPRRLQAGGRLDREHADEYGGDPDFIASPAARPAATSPRCGPDPDDPRYQPGFEDADTSVAAAVPFYGVYDFTNRGGYGPTGIVRLFLEPW